jgi:hypothetical protein
MEDEHKKRKLVNKIKETSEDIINAEDLKPLQDMYKSALSVISAMLLLFPKTKSVSELNVLNPEDNEVKLLSPLLLNLINDSDVDIFKGLTAKEVNNHPSVYSKGLEIANRVSSKDIGKEVFKRFEDVLNSKGINSAEMIDDVLKSPFASKKYDNPALEYVNDAMSSFFNKNQEDDIQVKNVMDNKNDQDDDIMMSLFLSFISQKHKDGAQKITGELMKEKLNSNQGAPIKDVLSVITKVVLNKSQEFKQKTNLRII